MPPAAFFHLENAPKSLAAEASPQTPLWELTALPRPRSWIKGPTSKGRGGGKGEERGGTLDPHNVGDRLTTLNMSSTGKGIDDVAHNFNCTPVWRVCVLLTHSFFRFD